MCTAISYAPHDHYFGRNLDLERSYGQCITITPRNYPFNFRSGPVLAHHHAMIGAAVVTDGFPLYFEATNETGLSIAALNYPNSAHYFPFNERQTNIAPFELIPWLLGQCQSVQDAQKILDNTNLWNESFSSTIPNSPLHWLLSDRERSIVIESDLDGLHIYDDPVGVLTNNPPFSYHMYNLSNFMQLTPQPPTNKQPLQLEPYSLGLGSYGLPGDMSSGSRFIKAAFTKLHSKCDASEESAVNQFFHILGSVYQQRGLTQLPEGSFEFTQYSSCCNTAKGIFYYKTYDNQTIRAIDMHRENLNGNEPIQHPMIHTSKIECQN